MSRWSKVDNPDFIKRSLEFIGNNQPVSIAELARHLDIGWPTSRTLILKLMAEGKVAPDRHNLFHLKKKKEEKKGKGEG